LTCECFYKNTLLIEFSVTIHKFGLIVTHPLLEEIHINICYIYSHSVTIHKFCLIVTHPLLVEIPIKICYIYSHSVTNQELLSNWTIHYFLLFFIWLDWFKGTKGYITWPYMGFCVSARTIRLSYYQINCVCFVVDLSFLLLWIQICLNFFNPATYVFIYGCHNTVTRF
jgi:hypothetical protein